MEIVLDASAVLAVLMDEDPRAALIEETRGADLASAPTLPWEVGNAVSALVRRDRLGGVAARAVVSAYAQVAIRLVAIDLGAAVEMATRHEIYAYDAYVIECARRLRAPLLTLDRRQREVARLENVPTLEVT